MSDSKKSSNTPITEYDKQLEKQRIKVANFVARKLNESKVCCICGKPGYIFHNPDLNHPYEICFICRKCKTDPAKVDQANKLRQDIRSKVNITKLSNKLLDDNRCMSLVMNYINQKPHISIGVYCRNNDITRYYFNQCISRVNTNHPELDILNKIKQVKTITYKNRSIHKATD